MLRSWEQFIFTDEEKNTHFHEILRVNDNWKCFVNKSSNNWVFGKFIGVSFTYVRTIIMAQFSRIAIILWSNNKFMVFAVVQHVCVFSPNDKKHLVKNYTLGLRLKISETRISFWKKIVRLVFIVKFINAKN